MPKIKSFTFVIVFGFAALGLTTSPAKALAIYSYTGNSFNVFQDNTPPFGSYNATMRVSGSFTVAAPLLSLPFNTDIAASVLSYSFDDGRGPLDNINSSISTFTMSTNAAGLPTFWNIEVAIPRPPPVSVTQQSRFVSTDIIEDLGVVNECTAVFLAQCSDFLIDFAQRRDTPGPWQVTVVSVPEPSTLLLFGVVLAALAGFGRRRRQV